MLAQLFLVNRVFFVHVTLNTQIFKTKHITITRYCFTFPGPVSLFSFCYAKKWGGHGPPATFGVAGPVNKGHFWSLWDLDYYEFNRGLSDHLDVKKKSKPVFKIDPELPNKSVLVTVASAWFKILLSLLVILLRRGFHSARKLGQWKNVLDYYWKQAEYE